VRTLDLDAERRAREEVLGEPPAIIFKGKTYELPREQPYAWGEAFNRIHQEIERAKEEAGYTPKTRVHIRAALVSVFGEEQLDQFEADNPSEDDVGAVVEGISNLYGDESGEAEASSDSSATGTRPSKRTGKESTDETSDSTSGDPSPSE
jgi:hypothetical protein